MTIVLFVLLTPLFVLLVWQAAESWAERRLERTGAARPLKRSRGGAGDGAGLAPGERAVALDAADLDLEERPAAPMAHVER